MPDAILLVSFGGPEGPDEVLPFLENVLRGRNVPRARVEEVARHYHHFGGRSPINEQCRALLAALERLLAEQGPALPIYWGNRNWSPFLEEAVRKMAADGISRAFAFVTNAFSSYSGCRQYREDIARACEKVDGAPEILKLRHYYNHPGFLEPMADRVRAAWREGATLLFTAHSIPVAMAGTCRYVEQLEESCRLVAASAGVRDYRLVYQSRGGPPSEPWLVPGILDELRDCAARGARDVVVAPIGFVSDHMEVIYDLDTEARSLASQLGLNMIRAGTVSADARFVAMIRELVLERSGGAVTRRALGSHGPSHDVCPEDCCPPPRRPGPR